MEKFPKKCSDSDSIDSIVRSFSKLMQLLDEKDPKDNTPRSQSTSPTEDCAVLKLRSLHEEITGIQDGIEKFRLFQEGQDLYTKWIGLVEQSNTVTCKVQRNNSNVRKILVNANGEDAHILADLVALAYNNRGHLKYLQVDFEGALEDYTMALKYNSALACAYYNRATVTYRLAFFQQAAEDMKTAVSLDPCKAEYHEGLNRVTEMIGSPTGHTFKLQYGDEHKTSDNM